MTSETTLTIEGERPDPDEEGKSIPLPATDVPSTSFGGLQWVMQAWGVSCVIQPGSSIKDDLRTAIQLSSRPKVNTVYKALGWTTIDGKRAYLHAGGAITAKGNDDSVTVQLPEELSCYDLTTDVDGKTGFLSSISLINLAPKDVAWPLWAACYAPLFGPVDFATHLTGRSGTFKSELISLFQSHFGPDMDARHLPGSWSSTGNALEAQAYYARNAPFVIDDFIPAGTSWQVRAYQTTADKVIRAQGNQSGRARLTDTSNLQKAMYPRGIVMSTGEDTPEGHSVRARMLIMELSPGDIDPKILTKAQGVRENFVGAIAALAQYLCKNPIDLKDRAIKIRNANLTIGHTRTPPMIGRLIATAEAVISWAIESGYVSKATGDKLKADATRSIMKAGENQSTFLEAADPVEMFLNAFRQVLQGTKGHIRTINGGVPRDATMLGWTEVGNGDIPTYKPNGPCIGWIDWDADEVFLEVNVGFNEVKKAAGNEMTLTKQTMIKRLKESGALTRTDDGRQRNTVRVTADGHPRLVLALAITKAIQTQEVPSDEEVEPTEFGSDSGGTNDGTGNSGDGEEPDDISEDF